MLKTHIKQSWLRTVLAVFTLLALFGFALSASRKSTIQSREIVKVSPGMATRLLIPAIDVGAPIQYVGVNSDGQMGVPDNNIDVGWYKFGSDLGQKGSAVIAGHFDGKNGETAVFSNLYKLKIGDKLSVRDDKGVLTTFIVRNSHIYDSGYADEVFGSTDGGIHLNLVTCDGVWDGYKKSFSKRLVVFTDLLI